MQSLHIMQLPNSTTLIKDIILINPKTSVSLIFCILASVTAEALGITATIPLLTRIVGDSQKEWQPSFLSEINLSTTTETYLLASFVGLAFLIKALILAASSFIMARAMSNYSDNIRKRYMTELSRANIQHINSSNIGKHVAILGTDSIRATTAYITCFRFVAALVQTTMFCTYAFLISFEVTLLALMAGTFLMVALRRLVSMSRQAGLDMTTSTHTMSTLAAQIIRGMTDFRSMAIEGFLIRQVFDRSTALKKAHFRAIFSGQFMRALQEPIVIICAILALLFMHFFVKLDTAIMLLVLGVFYRLLQSVSAVQQEYQRFVAQDSAVEAVSAGISAFAEHRDSQPSAEIEIDDTIGTTILFDNVSFSYGPKKILENFNATIEPKTITLFFGPSGSGKSTAIQLLTGLLEPRNGTVYVDKTDLSRLSRSWWRQKIGYMGQTPFFFNGSIAQNIDVGRQISNENLNNALKLCNCSTLISSLSDGIDTIIQEGGTNFSGGQIQRLALARAIASNPAVLILDEPTNGLDRESKTIILETIKDLSKVVTVVIISHDNDVLQYADTIVHFKDKGYKNSITKI